MKCANTIWLTYIALHCPPNPSLSSVRNLKLRPSEYVGRPLDLLINVSGQACLYVCILPWIICPCKRTTFAPVSIEREVGSIRRSVERRVQLEPDLLSSLPSLNSLVALLSHGCALLHLRRLRDVPERRRRLAGGGRGRHQGRQGLRQRLPHR